MNKEFVFVLLCFLIMISGFVFIVFNEHNKQQIEMNTAFERIEQETLLAEQQLNKINNDLDRILIVWEKCEENCNCECVLTDEGLIPTNKELKEVD
jgi:peptidoglycan hydrolase CwlO-like protein